ncbi:MAG: ShlB/FhaC/HecB family hemolysin secretion/activation protein [Pseudomonadota bacterium]|nr:ShlB/FhaC/HecB family hemolysin secretion/activation protein [Pseudomonadota bacterium]
MVRWLTRLPAGCALVAALWAADVRAEPAKSVSYGSGVENGAPASTGEYRALSFVHFKNQLGLGETLKIDLVSAGDFTELQNLSFVYEQPFRKDWLLTLKTAYARTFPGPITSLYYDQTTLDHGFGGSLTRYWRKSDRLLLFGTAGLQSSDGRTRRNATGSGILPERYQQRSRDVYGAFGFKFDPSDKTGLFSYFTLEQGVDWADPVNIRINSDVTPTVLRYSGTFKRNLPKQFQFAARGEAQWTDDRLGLQKQFTLGGWNYASAYLAGERLGDIGGGARVEINRLGVKTLKSGMQVYYQPFVFLDGGLTRNNDALPDEIGSTQKKASAGLGISFEATNGLHAGVQMSYPVAGGSDFEGGDSEPRFLFSIGFKR